MKTTNKDAYSFMLKDFPEIMNINEMCTALKVSTKTGYKLLKEGQIRCLKVGRSYRIPKFHVLAYMMIINHSNSS